MEKGVNNFPTVVAHRGDSLRAPENTLASLAAAQKSGAKWVEFDVQLTKDHVPVILHDERLDRTTTGNGLLAEKTYPELAALSAGAWFSETFSKEKIPTFAEYLKKAAGFKLGINIELKGNESQAAPLVTSVLKELATTWENGLPLPLISSANEAILSVLSQQAGRFSLGFIMDEWREDWEKRLSQYHCSTFVANHVFLNADRIMQIKAKNYFLLAYTVNDAAVANALLAKGVDGVFSDNPILLAQDR